MSQGAVAELFAGVGGFRLALEGHEPSGRRGHGWRVVWSNQWEPSTRKQHASDCYVARFGREGHINEDIGVVLDRVESGALELPQVDLLVGGFPCQDYSVARVLSQARGLEGRKGVLWWEIYRFLRLARPRFIFLENVDRLLKSPAEQRGRDFGVMLHCLSGLGYVAEWRVVNAADYGFPQRRRRTFIVGELIGDAPAPFNDPVRWITTDGVLARALPVEAAELTRAQLSLGLSAGAALVLPEDPVELSGSFTAQFEVAGVVAKRSVWMLRVSPKYSGPRQVLGDVLQPEESVPEEFFVAEDRLQSWRYLKGAKREERVVSGSGFRYFYTEGALAFPDSLDEPSRTILTGEGGPSSSRFKHIVQTASGRHRRLTPVELERLNGFPDDWTDTGMPAARRAFMMGNALVVGLVKRVGQELALRAGVADDAPAARAATG